MLIVDKYLIMLFWVSFQLLMVMASGCSLPSETSNSSVTNLVTETGRPNTFALITSKNTVPLCFDSSDHQGVIRAINDLQHDIERVTGRKPELQPCDVFTGSSVIIGTLDNSKLISSLVESGKLEVSDIKGKWESFVITTIEKPVPGVDQAMVIVGSDKRGTIYGIYELSQQLGVSPWYWWADVPVKKRQQVYINPGRYKSGEPKVKYRGIFINDENPSLGPWAGKKFGGCNSKMYVHMFELILRLRGNYLWPAMWGKSIYEDDPESARLANEYGVVLGSSHHEPMTRAQADWGRAKANCGNGQWNYSNNEEGLKKFWTEGIERNKDHEVLITIGMRGDGDEGMDNSEGMEAGARLMEKIVADQRKIIQDVKGVDPATVPQMWALYKEVTNFYDYGVRLPDDVTMLWCDDNWGNIRRLPSPEERHRSGRAGIYYHFDYCGSPHNYKWLNYNPLPKIWEQMNMAYHYGADRIWVVNVGDLKPMEVPIEFFIRMGWDPEAMSKEKIAEFTLKWAEREFGSEYAEEIANIVSKYAKYNGWRKPESIKPETFSQINYQEAERVINAWKEITKKAEMINEKLSPEYRDAFYQLVLYPTKASATVVEYKTGIAKHRLYTDQGRASANTLVTHLDYLYDLDNELRDTYHTIVGGKWRSMMNSDVLWKKTELPVKDLKNDAVLGVAVEGSKCAWPGETEVAKLPVVDSINQQRRWIDVFKRGSKNFVVSAVATKPWVILSSSSISINEDKRIWVSVDWDKVPIGEQNAEIRISGPEGQVVPIQLNTISSGKYTRKNVDAFGGLSGPIAISADSYVNNTKVDGVGWEAIPDYGRGSAGMAIFPVTAESILPPQKSPCLEYQVLITKTGEVHIDFILGVALKVQTDRGVRFAVSVDSKEPQVIDLFEDDKSSGKANYQPAFKGWSNWVMDNARTVKSTLQIDKPGIHKLKIWMVDPGVVLQEIILHDGDLQQSYFGPPVSKKN